MGSILASVISSRAGVLLNDESNDRWSEDDHLTAINDGQKEICLIKPDAHVVNVAYQLAAGTKQNIPDGTNTYQDPSSNTIEAGIMLLDIVRNMGTDGATPGNVITLVNMEQLDLALPGWHSVDAAATIVHYMFREADPKRFYVYPQQPAADMGWIEIVMAALPADVAAIGNAITLDDIYFTPLVNFVMYKAFMLDAEYAANVQLAANYYDSFFRSILGKEMREKAETPQVGGKGAKI